MKFVSTFSVLAAVVNAQVAIDLKSASDFTVVAVGGITNTGGSGPIIGNVATTGHVITGFPPGAIVGEVDVQNAAADQAHADAEAVWEMLRALEGEEIVATPDGTITVNHDSGDANGAGTTNFTGAVFGPGIHNALSIITIVTDVTLSGAGQFIFTSGSHLNILEGAQIILADGATADNVFFATGDATNVAADAVVQGTVLSNSAIRLAEGVTVLGNLYTQGLMTFTEASVTPVIIPQ